MISGGSNSTKKDWDTQEANNHFKSFKWMLNCVQSVKSFLCVTLNHLLT